MADTLFKAGVTKILASWLNDVNDYVYGQTTGQAPIWTTIPVQTWDTGETPTFDLSDWVISPDGSALTFTYITGSLPTSLSIDSAGLLSGTIDSGQGGTYEIVYSATNSSGTTTQALPALVVGLAISEPVWATGVDAVPNFTQEAGEQLYIDLNDYITSDGDPNGVSYLIFTYTHSVAAPAGLDFNVSGVISGATTTEATVNTTTITCINASGYSSTETFDITVNAIGGGSETPLMGGFYSGELACAAAVEPVFKDGVSLGTYNESEVVSIDLLTHYLASNGGAAVTEVLVDSGSLPTGWTLAETGASIGFITGDADVGQAASSPFTVSFTAENSVGVGTASENYTVTILDAAAIIPTLDSIDAVTGTNIVYFNFSEAVDAVTSYTLGVTITVNSVARNITAVGNVGSNRFAYTIDGDPLTQSNIINVVYSDTVGDLGAPVSTPADRQVDDADVSYTIPVPPVQGTIGFADFEAGTRTFKTGSVTWGTNYFPSNVTISTTNPKTGTYSMEVVYGANEDNVEVDFYLNNYYPDLWCKYDVFIPANYVHDKSRAGATAGNRKWFNTWTGTYTSAGREGAFLLLEAYPTSILQNSQGITVAYSRIDDSTTTGTTYTCPACGEGKMSNMITDNDLGKWMTLTIHAKEATQAQYLAQLALTGTYETGEGDGVFQVWKTDWQGNTTSRLNIQNGAWYGTMVDRVTPCLGFERGRFFGWTNANYAEETTFYIDNVTFSTEPLI